MRSFLIGIFLFILTSHSCFAQSVSHSFIPKEGRLLIVGQQKDTISEYLKSIGVVPGGFMVYTSIQKMDGLDGPADQGAGIHHAQYWTSRYPDTVLQIGLYMVGALDKTIQGFYDANISKLAKWIKRAKRPVYLRIGYEFDLPENGYDPQRYRQVFRYIVNRLREEGVDNVAFVWHSAAMTEHRRDFMDWYPGDDCVDWFGVSLFNPMQIKTAKELVVLAREHQKPFMVAESTPAGLFSVNAKKEWFRHYFDFINEVDVKIVCYINSNWNSYSLFRAQNWGDARIQKDPEIKAIWLKETENGYLLSSSDLFSKLSR
ncbi:MAG: hypothetical protein HQL21_07025 [Candidatus Omnitrophica bacterium]|nr:hypothetical protein [Candidatus Omnitrophota bacterium]